jgi:hypothetical protein
LAWIAGSTSVSRRELDEEEVTTVLMCRLKSRVPSSLINSWALHIQNAFYDGFRWIVRELVDEVCSKGLATTVGSSATFLSLAIPGLSCNIELAWLREPSRRSRGDRKGGVV